MTDRLILLTNDDGLWAPGLELLARVASRFGRVVVVAPDRNRSAVSSALSLHSILRLQEHGADRHACDGTPVDCVLVGACSLLPRRPDWVLSGVNHGYNLGEDVFYSGTVAAAFEGALQGARSAAFSMASGADPAQVEPWLGRFLEAWEGMDLPTGRIWNVNLPAGEVRGMRLTSQDSRTFHDHIVTREDPRGRPYHWIGGALPQFAGKPGSDSEAVREGYASLTPLRLDLGCPEVLSQQARFQATFGPEAL